jgi:serine protease Do
MSSFAKAGAALLAALLISTAASPISYAQAGRNTSIIQLNSSGSYLGIQMDDVTSANMAKFKLSAERGVIVRSVEKGTPAEKAGLHEDDVILEYAGMQVWSTTQFSRLVQETPVGRKVDLAISRDGKRTTLAAEIGDRSARTDGGRFSPFERMEDYFSRGADKGVFIATPGKPRLGLTLQWLSEQLAEHMGVPGKKGVLVTSVAEGSPSAGKIRAGDVIVSVDGKAIANPEDLTKIVREKDDGKIALKLIRDKKELTVEVTLPAAPSSGGEERGLKL